jgi:hypothetical protein
MSTQNDKLFPVDSVAMDSPRLAWLKANGLEIQETGALANLEDDFGDEIPAWVCRVAKPKRDGLYWPCEIDGGDTADEACANLAKSRGLKLWTDLP